MKNLLGIFALILLFSGSLKADPSLINIINEYHKRLGGLDKQSDLFLSEELNIASNMIKKVAIPCYRSALKDKNNYDINSYCQEFRVLLGDDANEWMENLEKIKVIATHNRALLNNDNWVNEWPEDKFEKYADNINKFSENILLLNEVFTLVGDK